MGLNKQIDLVTLTLETFRESRETWPIVTAWNTPGIGLMRNVTAWLD
jgi:predicted benzoate:H+ symporter BenE